jgi:hypothetical protein
MNRFLLRKSIALMVIFAFLSMICYSMPIHTNQPVKTEKQEKIKAAEGQIETEAEIDEFYSRDDANVIEDEGYPGGKKKKKFPWLLVIGGVVIVGVVLYFTVFKTKKFDLTVEVGEGVDGSPTTGTYSHKDGSTINYNYTLQTGYEQLTVTLDGAAAAASGAVTMDGVHTLRVSAVKSVNGTYKGQTNQGAAYPITIRVTKVGGVSTMTYYQIRMQSATNNLGYYVTLTVTGYPSTPITNYAFSYDGSYVDLSGNFTVNGTTTASGSWGLTYSSGTYGNFTGSGTFNVSKTAKAIPSAGMRLSPGQEKITTEIFKDGRLIKRETR